jgi:DNA/RNA-binding domain of Phe-tRNA-synthetase-like protein
MPAVITVEPHALLDLRAFVTRFPRPLGEIAGAARIDAAREAGADVPVARGEGVQKAVRDLLRAGGFKPAGRSKPASEYLIKAAADGALPAINPAVDACNVVALHSGIPVSVVDLDRATAPFRVAIAPEGTRYVFNASGQEIDVGRLLCLLDADGPCANAVKDAQRTKTTADTRQTLSILWGPRSLAAEVDAALAWYRALLAELGAETEGVFPA